MDSDRILLNRAAQGCKDSLRQIYETYKDHLLTLARGLTGGRGEAEDIVHDVFVAFARNLPVLRLHGSLKGYLSVGVCNRARDLGRARIRHRGASSLTPVSEVLTAPDRHATEAELLERLRAALSRLPADQREVLLLRSRAGLSFKEIARHQGTPVNTAQGRYRYGIEKLRSLLNSELEA
jgi:RNA polymerase sigma-70 factor (ECF subfamily)